MPIYKRLHDQLRPLWDRAGYDGGTMGSAAVVPPPSKDWRRLYHLTTAEHAISDIVFCRLKVAMLDQLNDPFELFALRFLNNRAIAQAVKEYGILCFSKDWTDPVLWTHYAAKHTGICLGFDVPKAIALEVQYQYSRIEVKQGVLTDELRKTLLRTKYLSWGYEHEWRVQVTLNDASKEGKLWFEPIGKRIHLAEVILGAQCDMSFNEVMKLVDAHHKKVVTFKARLANDSFNIVPDERTIPITLL